MGKATVTRMSRITFTLGSPPTHQQTQHLRQRRRRRAVMMWVITLAGGFIAGCSSGTVVVSRAVNVPAVFAWPVVTALDSAWSPPSIHPSANKESNVLKPFLFKPKY